MQHELLITPGSEQVRATIERDGQLDDARADRRQGARQRLRPVHRPVAAGRHRDVAARHRRQANTERPKARNSIINSFNRNFPRRNDGNPDTLAFIASPEIVIAYGLAGRLSFNPLTDTLEAADGSTCMLEPPADAPDLPPRAS